MRLIKKEWMAGAVAGAALALAGLALAQVPTTGIYVTKHNLGSTGTGNHVSAADTAEICVFCHTPHGADTSATAPLWNKRIPTGATYQVYSTVNSTTIDGAVASVGSVSVTCLSCHDGTQAMDNIINAPGSGGVLADGGGLDGRSYTWTGGTVNAAGRMTGIAALGTDLVDDHPIGIEYCGGGLTGTTPNAAAGPIPAAVNCKDADFKRPYSGTINGQGVWWVETGSNDTARTRTDMILYNRNFTVGGPVGPAVECASCHDPHVSENQTGPNSQVAGKTFLRISNDGSAVCLACHTK